jgi:selenocysteine-specific elongation factor
VARGDVVVSGGSALQDTYLLDAELVFEDSEPEHGDRVQVHHGTRDAPARLAWLGGRFWQLRLEQPLIPAAGDRLVVRRIAPPDTLGGGRVLDPHPRKHGPSRDLLAALEHLARGEVAPAPDPEPDPEPDKPSERPALRASALELEARLRAAGFEPPLDSDLDARDLAALRDAGRAVRVSQALHYHPDTIAVVKRLAIESAEQHGGSITIAQLRDELHTSRKFAQAQLEHLDAERVTIRRGDQHFLRRRHEAGSG